MEHKERQGKGAASRPVRLVQFNAREKKKKKKKTPRKEEERRLNTFFWHHKFRV